MAAPYAPPFAITPAIVALIADIAERVGQYAQAGDSAAALRLRPLTTATGAWVGSGKA